MSTWPPLQTGQYVSVVAEIGPNHAGSLAHALDLIDAAAVAGANAVKFQFYRVADMVPPDSTHEAYRIPQKDGSPWAGRWLAEVYEAGLTPVEWFPRFKEYAEGVGLVAFASAFHPEVVQQLAANGCPAFKIASPEVADEPLLRALSETDQLPIVLSDGVASPEQVHYALSLFQNGGHPTVLLRCVSAYPAPASDYALRDMRAWVGAPNAEWGLSDHTRGSAVACAAVGMGATMIEKHLMLGSGSYKEPPLDAAHSLTPYDFAEFVADVREAARAYWGWRPDREVAWRRRLAWRCNLGAGARVFSRHLRTVRAASGLSAERQRHVAGRVTSRPVSEGDPVSMADIE